MRLLGHRYYIMVSPSSTASTASENKSEKGVWFSLRYRFESLRFAATFLKPCRISRSWDGSKHLAMTVFINAAVITTERREKIGGGGLSHLQWSTCSGRVIAGRRVRLRSIRDSTNAKSNRDIQRSLRFFIFFTKSVSGDPGRDVQPKPSRVRVRRTRVQRKSLVYRQISPRNTARSHATAISPFQMNQKVASQNFLKKPRERASLAAKITKPRCEIL